MFAVIGHVGRRGWDFRQITILHLGNEPSIGIPSTIPVTFRWPSLVVCVQRTVVIVVGFLTVVVAVGGPGDVGDHSHFSANGLRRHSLHKVRGEKAISSVLDAVQPALLGVGVMFGHHCDDFALLESQGALVFTRELSQGLDIVILARVGLDEILIDQISNLACFGGGHYQSSSGVHSELKAGIFYCAHFTDVFITVGLQYLWKIISQRKSALRFIAMIKLRKLKWTLTDSWLVLALLPLSREKTLCVLTWPAENFHTLCSRFLFLRCPIVEPHSVKKRG